jgi:hypothetical protein
MHHYQKSVFVLADISLLLYILHGWSGYLDE